MTRASIPAVAGGALVVDVGTAASTSGIGAATLRDLGDVVMTTTVRDYTFVFGTQVFLFVVSDDGTSYVLLALEDAPPLAVGRIELGGTNYDDVTTPIQVTTVFRLQLATTSMAGGTEMVWSYAPSDTAPFVEVRRQLVTDTFDATYFGVEYQTFATTASEPPPVRIETLHVEVPCM